MEISKADFKDIKELVNLAFNRQTEYFTGNNITRQLLTLYYGYLTNLKQVMVAREDGKIVGFMPYWRVGKKMVSKLRNKSYQRPFPYNINQGSHLFIAGISIDKDYEKKGVPFRLTRAILRENKDIKEISSDNKKIFRVHRLNKGG